MKGGVSEWLKEHAWKVCIGQKPIAGSNPAPSANQKKNGKNKTTSRIRR